MKLFTQEQVAQHASAASLWIIIHGNVYDMTPFLSEHPGGKRVLEKVNACWFIVTAILIFFNQMRQYYR